MFALLLLLNTFFGTTQLDSLQISTEISEVIVYQNQAQIHRIHSQELPSGTSVLVFENLSELLLIESVQLIANKGFTLVSITVQNSFEQHVNPIPKLNALREQKELLEEELVAHQSQLEVVIKEISFIDLTKNIVAENKLTAPELNELLTTYRENLSHALQRQDELEKQIRELKSELHLINQRINESGRLNRVYSKEVIAVIDLDEASDIEFELSYLVTDAGWYPTYDIRSASINEPIELTYKANIFQNTGRNWDDVAFTINSGDPSSNAIKPTLNPLFLNYYRHQGRRQLYGNAAPKANNQVMQTLNQGLVTGKVIDAQSGQTLPAVNILIEGTNIGTTTDIDGRFTLPKLSPGNYTLSAQYIGFVPNRIPITIRNNGYEIYVRMEQDVLGLDEVVVSGVSSRFRSETEDNSFEKPSVPNESPMIIQNTVTSNQTSFSYELSKPYSVASDGKTHTVDIKRELVESRFMYAAVPKLAQNAYLEGKIENTADLNLIPGDANIYFENRFVGTSYIDPVITQDTIAVSMGKDEQIVINREKLTDFSSKNFFRNKVRELQTFEITVKNTKNETVSILIEDQIPISGNEEIDVDVKELSDGILDKETGIVQWNLALEPGESVTLRLGFEIEYEKGKQLNIW